MKQIILKRNRYVDSVTLMAVSEEGRKCPGVDGAEAVMCTRANRELLEKSGYEIARDIGANDLVLAASGEADAVKRALEGMENRLNGTAERTRTYRSLDDPELAAGKYDLVQISLPGEYVEEEALRALERGYHLFIFSDNVPLATEKKLKERALEKGLLCMGPDCGVAQLGGVALGAGSILPEGRVGIVGASGSGAQEVACILASFGEGVSELIGTGGRDLFPKIGGAVMMQGMKLLDADARTQVIVLVSKIADPAVMQKVLSQADGLGKPTVAVFLGAPEDIFTGHRTAAAHSLEEAALKCAALLGAPTQDFGFSKEQLDDISARERAKYAPGQRYLRGLYCGGTFAEEGLLNYRRLCPGRTFYSNLSIHSAQKLADKERSVGDCVLDLGAEDFTAEAPHPVFEPELRLRRLRRELLDEEVAVITLDFITGPGVHPDPAGAFCEEIRLARKKRKSHVTVIANICGSPLDPQDTAKIARRLEEAGVIVAASNLQTVRLAAHILNGQEGQA